MTSYKTVGEEVQELLEWTLDRLKKLEKIESAITEYNYALDNRKHGGVAQDVAFNRICNILTMQWSDHVAATGAKKEDTK